MKSEYGRRVSALVAFAFATLACSSAAIGASIPDNLVSSLSYKVVGTITPSCTVTQPTQQVEVIGLQDLDTDTIKATDTDLPFTVSCTAPVKVTMASAQGGLKTAATTSDGDFASLVGYKATLDMPGANDALECRSDEMANGGAGCVRQLPNEAFDGNGRIRIHTSASGELLLAGTYNDTVTLTVSPQLDGSSEGDE